MCPIPAASEGTQGDALSAPAGLSSAWRFLDFLFGGVDNGYAEFRYFSPGRKPKAIDHPTYLPLPLDKEQFAAEVLSRNGRQMIAVGVAPRCRIPGTGKPAKDQDVLQVGCIWANINNRSADGGAVTVIERVEGLPLRPSVVVNSGYGHHVYYFFHSPLRLGRLIDWSRMTRSLRDLLRSDDRITLSQAMRLPGTLNIKEPQPEPCELSEEYSSWTRYGIDEVRDAIERALSAPPPSRSPSTNPSSLAAGSARLDDLRRRGVSQEIVDAVVTGRKVLRASLDAGLYDAESGSDFLIAFALHEKGFSPEEIKAVFRANPNGCGSTWARKRRGETYLEVVLSKVLRRARDAQELGFDGARQRGEEDYEEETRFGGLPPNYSLGADGALWFHPPVTDEDRAAPQPVKIGNSAMRIAEIQEDVDTGNISLLITFNYLGKPRSTPILRSQMSDSRQLVAALAGRGAPVTANNARRLIAYLAAYEHAFAATIPQKKITSRFGRGRSSGPFFLPGLSPAVEFAPQGSGDASLFRAYSSRRGSLPGWLGAARSVADENLMIPQVATLAAFVSPLQRRLQIPNFILDIHGGTSTGKSTSLKLAASVYGKPDDPDSLILQWMNTSAAVEQVAWTCGELPVFLDDAQHCPAALKRSVVYMIANGRGKGRGAKGGGGGIRETPTWHTVALSTSEEPLHESSPHEGARGRILSVGGLAAPFPPGAASLVQSVERTVAANHGHAGEAFVRHLNGWAESDWWAWQKRYAAVRAELLAGSGSNLAGRVSGYIAAVQLAGEIACPLLGLPFKPDVIGAWLMLHLREQQNDQNQALLALRALTDYYVANKSRFAGDESFREERRRSVCGAVKPQQYVGFLRSTVESVFRQRRWGVTAVLNKLADAGALHSTEGDRHTKKVSVGGVKHRMVCLKWSAIFDNESGR